MTREEAQRRAAELQAGDTGHRFVARERGDGVWEVVKVPIPEQLRHGAYTETIAATPRPSQPDDPRTGNEQRVPGLPGGF